MKNLTYSGFTTKRAKQKKHSHVSFASERREKNRPCGFTLVETMVAVTILTLSVAGPLFAASRALVSAQIAQSQLTASYLAQEGIEYLRAMRDNEYLALYPPGAGTSAAAWNNFINGSDAASITQCRAPAICTLDPLRTMGTGTNLALTVCSGNSCTPLYLANGVYTEQSGVPGAMKTQFTRVVQATTVSANEQKITSTVTWSFHGTPYTITVTDHLSSWQ